MKTFTQPKGMCAKSGILLFLILSFSIFNLCEAQYTELHIFNDTNGAVPQGSLTLSGNTMFGMAYGGGNYGDGVIFSIHTDGSGFTDLFDFNGTNGAYPYYTILTLSGNTLFGMTNEGGAHNKGLVFSIHTDGSAYSDLLDFNITNGEGPYGSLTLSGNTLYGMTVSGGADSDGIVFSINTNGSGYSDLYNFDGTNGLAPFGSLTLSGSTLFGMTANGGVTYVNANNPGDGRIFSINTNGSGYSDLLDFTGTNGAIPWGCNLTLSGNVLYGMTRGGGGDGNGLIFSINTNGSGFSDLFDFDGTNGQNPYGSLVISGNTMYGMTYFGGSNLNGNIFSMNTNDNTFTQLFTFNGTEGKEPLGNVTLIGNELLGITEYGGTYSKGVIFSFTLPAPVADICYVTVDTASQFNEVLWSKTGIDTMAVDSFRIYRQAISSYQYIGHVSVHNYTEFIDSTSQPNTVSASYEICTVDTSGEYSVLSPPNQTILLQANVGVGNVVNLSWNAYVGDSVNYYVILRDSAGANNWQRLDSVTNNIYAYTDNHPPHSVNLRYEIITVWNLSCVPYTHAPLLHHQLMVSNEVTSRSNQKELTVTGIPSVNNLPEINIYPNPANDVVYITLTQPSEVAITLMDDLGRNIYNTNMTTIDKAKQMDVSALTGGIYFLKMTMSDGSMEVKKLVVLR